MPKGIPIRPKCPKCKRGKYGKQPMALGLQLDYTRVRARWVGRYFRGQVRITCLDCGHEWWSSLNSEKVHKLLERR